MAKTKYTTENIAEHIPHSLIVQAENGDTEEFQQYVYKSNGKRVPTGINVGYERKQNGEYKFYMCSDITFEQDI